MPTSPSTAQKMCAFLVGSLATAKVSAKKEWFAFFASVLAIMPKIASLENLHPPRSRSLAQRVKRFQRPNYPQLRSYFRQKNVSPARARTTPLKTAQTTSAGCVASVVTSPPTVPKTCVSLAGSLATAERSARRGLSASFASKQVTCRVGVQIPVCLQQFQHLPNLQQPRFGPLLLPPN